MSVSTAAAVVSSSSSSSSALPAPPPTTPTRLATAVASLPPTESHVQVAVRCRPLNEREKAAGRPPVLLCKSNSHEVAVAKRRSYAFDRVFGQYSTQSDVFKAVVRPAVDEALAGYNCTVFAYGQTGTGKTHTMQGALSPDDDMAGIIPRCVRYIFSALQASSPQEFSVKVSFLQLYNEELQDLLAPESKKLRLMEDPKRGGVYCQNLLEVTTTSASQVYELLETGVRNRVTSETLMNENSSRSHSIFTIRIHSKENNPGGEDLIKTGQLNLVDLAGSECIGRSGARNARAREAGNINQSLLTLGRVITALVDNHPHIPYRDSKLTRLLQESLGGRAKTTIIATVAPCADSIDETMSTLEYAHRAKHIKNRPEVNQKTTKAGLLKEYGTEIETLRSALSAARAKDGIFLPPAQFAEMQERLVGQAAQLAELEDELEGRNRACKELEDEVTHQKEELRTLERAKQEKDDALADTQRTLTTTQATLETTQTTLATTTLALRAYETNERVLLANGERAAALFRESEERVTRLMEKIERKRVVDDANSRLAGSFSETSAAQIAAFQARLEQHQEQQAAFVADVSASVEQLQTAHDADVDELVRTLARLQALTSARRMQQAEEAEQEQLAGSQVAEKLELSIQEKQSTAQSGFEALVALSVDHAAKIAAELSAAKTQSTAFLAAVSTALTDARAETTQFLAEQREKLLELQAAIDASVSEQAKQLHANRERLVAALRASHEKQQQELDAMKRHVAQIVDTCVVAQAATLQEQTVLVEANATEQTRQLESVRAVAEHEVRASVDAWTRESTRQEARSTELQGRVASMHSQVDELSTRHDTLIAAGVREQTQSIEEMATTQSAASETLVALVAEQHASTAAFAASREASNSDFVAKHDDLSSSLSSAHLALQTQLRVNAGATKRKFETVAQSAAAVVDEATQQATQQRHELATYMKKRKVDAATGTTPTKKSVSFPSFVATKVVAELPVADEVSAQAFSATASQASTASTSSVASNESDDDDTTEAVVAPLAESKAVKPTETSTAKPLAPPSTSSGTIRKFGARTGVSGMANVSKLKPAAAAADRKLKIGGKQLASSLPAPRKFR